MAFTNESNQKIRKAAKDKVASPMNIELSRRAMWTGISEMLIMSILSENPSTPDKISMRLSNVGVSMLPSAVMGKCERMLSNGLLTAVWLHDPNSSKRRTVKKYSLSPEGWVYLSFTESIWKDMSKKVNTVLTKIVYKPLKSNEA